MKVVSSPSVSRCTIIEPESGGHRLWYVRLLAEHLLERGSEPAIVTTPETLLSREWDLHLKELADSFSAIVAVPSTGHTRWLAEAVRVSRSITDEYFLPDGDKFLWALARTSIKLRLVRDLYNMKVLLLRFHAVGSIIGRVRFGAKVLLVSAISLLGRGVHLATLEISSRDQNASARRLRLSVVNDPVSFRPLDVPKADWLRAHGLRGDRILFLAIGDLSERKCVPEIIAAWHSASPAAATLALIGRPSSAVERNLELPQIAARDDIFLLDGYVDDQAFDTWINAADYVFVVHRNEGSSGVLLKAQASGTPIIAGGSRLVINAVCQDDMARLVEPRRESLAEAIRSCAEARGVRPRKPAGCEYQHAFAAQMVNINSKAL